MGRTAKFLKTVRPKATGVRIPLPAPNICGFDQTKPHINLLLLLVFSCVETNSTDVSLAAFLDVAIKIMNLIKLLCEVKKMIGKNVVVVVGVT